MPFANAKPVLIGLGANLPSHHGAPMASLVAALRLIQDGPVRILARSPWYESEPIPASDQSWYINAVIAGTTLESPDNLLKELHKIEQEFGRERGVVNAARPLDLDLLAYGDAVTAPAGHGIAVLPHPRLSERAFVLRPLADIAPHWRHPTLKAAAEELLARLPAGPGLRLARGSDAAQ
ncbi:MAG: 2-amino-4-hydroxy-6-hydroxymethyldihydropteridine diphosphokinase [Rhodospirillales bacterium]